jgi:hypothetical protein
VGFDKNEDVVGVVVISIRKVINIIINDDLVVL